MAKATPSTSALPPIVFDGLKKLGQDIRTARKKRRLSMKSMAERMMVNLKTVQRLESGDPSVGIGIIAAALWVLGVHRRIGELVAPESDHIGLQEDVKNLPRDFRRSKKRRDSFDF